ncbi:hypothetical protein PY365_11735 [Roseiarcaceae bacterium H3SJ34-1]|uniref:hypothetical protein n=1 Tax=Terripilifer ovatus TaxID=3032367 RepID=UPI003AB99B6D|nr:hypothetical protein [Roseiarcaceae bacterium H3SJ34-1]
MEDTFRGRPQSRELAIGAVFGDGEPAIRLRKIGARSGRVSLLSASIRDGDEVVGFAVCLLDDGNEEDHAGDIETLKTKVRHLGGHCCLIEQKTIERPRDTSVLLVRTLLDLQRLVSDRT